MHVSRITIGKTVGAAVLSLFVLSACLTPSVITVSSGSSRGQSQEGQGASSSLPGTISANNETIRLQPGRYGGTLTIRGNRVTVIGAGTGSTEIAGNLRITGNSATVSGLTISGSVLISGNNADLTGARILGSVQSSGNNNRW